MRQLSFWANVKGAKKMQEYRKIRSLETMERITQQQLQDLFDEILDRVDREDIGFVILGEDGQGDCVLCPAHWFPGAFDSALA